MRTFTARTIAGCLLLAGAIPGAWAQQGGAAKAADDPVNSAPTLHVYVNLMQIPVLVLDQWHKQVPPVPPSRFKVDIEGLPPFTPYRVRRQGDDPISLAILLDGSDPDEALWKRLPEASRALAAELRPHDRVEIYGMDGCKLRRFLGEEPFDAGDLYAGLERALAVKAYSTQRKKLGPCARPVKLGDALLYLAATLGQRSGRRVLLALSGSEEMLPPAMAEQLHQLLNAQSTTLFGIRHSESDSGFYATDSDAARMPMQTMGRGGRGMLPAPIDMAVGASLQTESENSGGMTLGASIHSLPKVLARTLELVRGRYILEFPRPAQLPAGQHLLHVSAGNPRQFIRPAGISVPTATKDELAMDPAVEHGVLTTGADDASDPPDPLKMTDVAKPVVQSKP